MTENKDILIIDDEDVILDAVSKIAAYEGFTSEKCNSVKTAEQKIKSQVFSLIICDIMMPEKDGFEFLETLKTERINTPVVITTGYSSFDNAVKSLYEGAIGFIPKPFSVDELSSIIRRGMEYNKIFLKSFNNQYEIENPVLDFIPCPPKYFRLGFDSWINKADEGIVTVGLTDLFLKSIGSIDEIDFMNIEESIYQGGNFLKIKDNLGNYHQVLSPLSGKIIDTNEKLIIDKSLMEKDPYF